MLDQPDGFHGFNGYKNKKVWKTQTKLLNKFLQQCGLADLLAEKELTNENEEYSHNLPVSQPYQNIVLDNRDYKLKLDSVDLLQYINECAAPKESKSLSSLDRQGNFVDDIFVLPNKQFIIVRFCSSEAVFRFCQCLGKTNLSCFGTLSFCFISDCIYDACLKKYQPLIKEQVDHFHPANRPEDLILIEDFVDEHFEERLIGFVSCYNFDDFFTNLFTFFRQKVVLLKMNQKYRY